jgi:hypothetical protein
MKTEDPTNIKALIEELEEKKLSQEQMLISHFNATFESLKPINMIKSTLKEFGKTPDLKNNLLDATLGVGAGLLSKKLVVGGSNNIFRKVAGTIVEFAIATIIAKNSDKIKSAGKNFANKLGKEKKPAFK